MSFLVEQAFLGRDEIRAPLETPTWEATKQGKQKYALLLHFFLLELILCSFIIHDVFVLFCQPINTLLEYLRTSHLKSNPQHTQDFYCRLGDKETPQTTLFWRCPVEM